MRTSAERSRCRGRLLLGLAGSLALVAGCSSSKFEFADVEGRVLLDGEPVPEAKVVFMPTSINDDGEAGPYSRGRTGADGRFTLQSLEDNPRKGAVVGPHKIIVSTKKARLDPDQIDVEIIESPETIPRQYTYYRRTPLTFSVPSGGTDAADLLLESAGR